MATQVARDFEDLSIDYDWPTDLRRLHTAARSAWATWSDLDDALSAVYDMGEDKSPDKRGPMADLAGQAYATLKAIRTAGEKRLAEWEASQAPQPEPPTPEPLITAAVYACIDCGDGTFAGMEYTEGYRPACPNCGRTSGVYKQYGGVPVAQAEPAPVPLDVDLWWRCRRDKNDLVIHNGIFPARSLRGETPPCPICGKSDQVELHPDTTAEG